jgi:hypothetical protein
MANTIVKMAQANGGLITSRQVTAAGIPRSRILELVDSGELERVECGVYCLAGSWEDEFKIEQLRFFEAFFLTRRLSSSMTSLTGRQSG